MLVYSSSRLGVAEGEELGSNILPQDCEGLRGDSHLKTIAKPLLPIASPVW